MPTREARNRSLIQRLLIHILSMPSPRVVQAQPKRHETHSNKIRRIQSETESGILIDITSHDGSPSREGGFVIGVEVTQPLTISILNRKARTSLLILRLLTHVLIVPPSREIEKTRVVGTRYMSKKRESLLRQKRILI
ncbi:hypothetical protein AVEN_135807-1 [Araneus ventricosus]|uniref:Uncharacterized protein n=1 Tax=Araneus ventricosus TaxID=182803 RepID=A0A4Y2UFX2_ARAVE|nr:hypothetical protein AVEN_135807-1 [Araneus ventricosus]